MRLIRLIAERQEELWNGQADHAPFLRDAGTPYGPREHLAYLKERRGEKIVVVDDEQRIVGWIGVFPGRDQRGPFFHLEGFEVREEHRGRGIGTALMQEAKAYIGRRKAHRMLFDVSPLLTQNAVLFVTHFGARYRWLEGSRTPEGRPWPECSCECDFTNPLDKPPDMREEEVTALSVLDWDGLRPTPRREASYRGLRSVLLPPMDLERLAQAAQGVPGLLETMTEAFRALHLHGYGFVWFDRTVYAGRPFYYYLMRQSIAL
jgi:GNAT superfamily N-acetyltransferase